MGTTRAPVAEPEVFADASKEKTDAATAPDESRRLRGAFGTIDAGS
jgi:hypothetical protein